VADRYSRAARHEGALKEMVQKRGSSSCAPDAARTNAALNADVSVALLPNQAPGEVKITFAGHVSTLNWRPEGDPKEVRTRGGASIYSWAFDFPCAAPTPTGRCRRSAKWCRTTSPLIWVNSVGAVEISEYREPNSPILMARQCPS
jgi:hypothetical protein